MLLTGEIINHISANSLYAKYEFVRDNRRLFVLFSGLFSGSIARRRWLIHKTKVLYVFSERFGGIPSDKELEKSLKHKKYEEIQKLSYNGTMGNVSQIQDFCSRKCEVVSQIKNDHRHISIFAICEMPILVWIGYSLGKTLIVDLFRKTRDNVENQWRWKNEGPLKWIKRKLRPIKNYSTSLINGISTSSCVNLFIECSALIDRLMIHEDILSLPSYSLKLDTITNNYLQYRFQLNQFKSQIETIQRQIDSDIGPGGTVNLFLTVPAPFAVIIGQNIHPNGPKYLVYDLNNELRTYNSVLTINNK